jgi:hypothetical protein
MLVFFLLKILFCCFLLYIGFWWLITHVHVLLYPHCNLLEE